jgi:hypothetical protein
VVEVSKTQEVRLFDVFVLAPWLVWLGARKRSTLSPLERFLLVAAGVGTAAYNAKNYAEEARRRENLERLDLLV